MGTALSKFSNLEFFKLVDRLSRRSKTANSSGRNDISKVVESTNHDLLVKSLRPISDEEVATFLSDLEENGTWSSKWDMSEAPIRDSDVLVAAWKKHPNPNQLQSLTIHKCFHLTLIPSYVAVFVNLTSLDLRDNCIDHLPWYIVFLKSLIYFDLSFNMLTHLPQTIGYLSSLEVLKVAGNHLTYLPTEILRLENLKELDVSKNFKLNSPPLSLCNKGLEKIKQALKKRLYRKDVWEGAKPWVLGDERHSYTHEMKSLMELCIDTVIVMKIDFLTMTTVPPGVKTHLTEQVADLDHRLKVSKCSLCSGYFSTKESFNNHFCCGS